MSDMTNAEEVAQLVATLRAQGQDALAWELETVWAREGKSHRGTLPLWGAAEWPVGPDGRWQRLIDRWADQLASGDRAWDLAVFASWEALNFYFDDELDSIEYPEQATEQRAVQFVTRAWDDTFEGKVARGRSFAFEDLLCNGPCYGDVEQIVDSTFRARGLGHDVSADDYDFPPVSKGQDYAEFHVQIEGDEASAVQVLRDVGAYSISTDGLHYSVQVDADWSRLREAYVGRMVPIVMDAYEHAKREDVWDAPMAHRKGLFTDFDFGHDLKRSLRVVGHSAISTRDELENAERKKLKARPGFVKPKGRK